MGYYSYIGIDEVADWDDRSCVMCGATNMLHVFKDDFDHPFIVNNLELLEWKLEQKEKQLV